MHDAVLALNQKVVWLAIFTCINIADYGGAMGVVSKWYSPFSPRLDGKLAILPKWAHNVDAHVDLVQESKPVGNQEYWGKGGNGGLET